MYTNFIYIGPSCPQLGLKQWGLFFDPDPPFTMKEYIAKNPLLRCLYIPTEHLGEARKNLRIDKQSAESLAFKAFNDIVSKLPR